MQHMRMMTKHYYSSCDALMWSSMVNLSFMNKPSTPFLLLRSLVWLSLCRLSRHWGFAWSAFKGWINSRSIASCAGVSRGQCERPEVLVSLYNVIMCFGQDIPGFTCSI